MTGRLLWITERYPPSRGGMAVSCARQVFGLRRRGVLLDVLTMTAGGPEAGVRSATAASTFISAAIRSTV